MGEQMTDEHSEYREVKSTLNRQRLRGQFNSFGAQKSMFVYRFAAACRSGENSTNFAFWHLPCTVAQIGWTVPVGEQLSTCKRICINFGRTVDKFIIFRFWCIDGEQFSNRWTLMSHDIFQYDKKRREYRRALLPVAHFRHFGRPSAEAQAEEGCRESP